MKKRRAHVLAKTASATPPGHVVFFDTETRETRLANGDRKLTLRLGYAMYCRSVPGERLRVQRSCTFQDPLELWQFVDSCCGKNEKLYLVAHNLVFDLLVGQAFFSLYNLGWSLDSFYTKGATNLFRWHNGKRRLAGVDNMNLFPGKLAEWGHVLGLPKLPVVFEMVSQAELLTYCIRDVEIMRRCWLAWLGFLDENQCGAFRETLGSTAFSAWRHAYMHQRVHIHDEPLALSLEREAYRGGRCECLYQGRRTDGPFYYVDVNSMYGHVLERYNYPAGLSGSAESSNLELLVRRLHKYAVIARVEIETDEPWFPLLVNGHTTYPVGRFWSTLTTPELVLCAKRGWLRQVSAMSWYRPRPLFAGYIRHFGQLRLRYHEQGNTGYERICKLLINSLYGKFGQQGFDQRIIGQTGLDEFWTRAVYDIERDEHYRMVALAGHVYAEHKTGEGYNSFPAIAAHVTAYARLELHTLKQCVPPGHVFYMDTDSLIVDQVGLDALAERMHPTQLGMLKIEHTSDELVVHAPKDYEMAGRIKTKGIRTGAVQTAPGVYRQDQWLGLAGLLRRGVLDGAIITTIEKRQQRVIYSGWVSPSGWVQPFVLGQEQAETREPRELPVSGR